MGEECAKNQVMLRSTDAGIDVIKNHIIFFSNGKSL